MTGLSSGIGFEAALSLADNGYMTYATIRDKKVNILNITKEKNLLIKYIELDVDNGYSVEKTINDIIEKEKRIDLLINNAGFNLIGSAKDLTSEEIYSIFNTNVFGIYRKIRNVVSVMREHHSGTIIKISSLDAILPTPFCSAYVATKSAIGGVKWYNEFIKRQRSQKDRLNRIIDAQKRQLG